MSSSLQTSVDTIAAISTPRGRGAIAIIRLSGPKAHEIAARLWQGKQPVDELESRRLYSGKLIIDGKLVDQALITFSRAPHSYTGEDTVELHTHGSIALTDAVLSACLSLGAKLAGPGEFTRRALVHGKLDVAQAEAVADLVDAESQALVRLAADQLAGGLSSKIDALLGRVVALAAAEAAYLDFSEEDIDATAGDGVEAEVAELIKQCEVLLSASQNVKVLRDGLSVALVGLPNAGKSTLLNALLGFDRSIVTNIAGTTRDTIEERVVLGDIPIRLIDTAGLNSKPDKVEAMGIERTAAAIQSADLVLVLIAPGKKTATKQYLESNGMASILTDDKVIILHTKSDVAGDKEDGSEVGIGLSAQTGQGIDALKSAIVDRATHGQAFEGTMLTTKRQIEIVGLANNHLVKARKLLQESAPRDIVLVELEAAAQELTLITGVDSNEAMLDDMFSRFCIGK